MNLETDDLQRMLEDYGMFFSRGFSRLRKDALYPNKGESVYKTLTSKIVPRAGK